MGWSGNLAAQKLTEFLSQRLDPFLDVGCFTELFWRCVNHGGRLAEEEKAVKRRTVVVQGRGGNDHREAVSDGRAPRKGARPSPDVLQADPLEQAPQRRVWHPPAGVQHIFCAATRRSPLPPPGATSVPSGTLRVDRSRMSKLHGALGTARHTFKRADQLGNTP